MPACPKCGSDVREGKTFCGGCGASMTDPTTNRGGNSKIEIDLKLLNSLLEIFVNKPGEPHYQVNGEGGLQVQLGDVKIGLEPFQVNQVFPLQFNKGNLKPCLVHLQQVQLDAQGLKVSLQLKA